ncbi:FAD/NAD(P)-binding oxidoreductase [Streptomyces angustmyceticus]|uniref:Pyridine nucleotide-disulfide oxidoreductase n=1 Tax=Streptomyces angustmyceticus TaxID=285578 RepID=A0A5J4LH85_9ACTN|nr:FAD/NAD(P)-binding oxidoreductase [Streptomyces angustmyceticus]UAL67617.1 NAD(P)/FAD-dependent oxidoreductase [Streptomyces angustmyceticus]GES31402.1 pyridine nucleotide-disulfide oxidoreductase [Streptomyces angustmyceticus]
MDHIVVVGASAAGLTAADTLRREGFTGTLTMVGDELRPPYDRPPLSKQVLAGEWEPHKATLRQESDVQRLRLQMVLGHRATEVDPAARAITLDGRERIGYDGLIVATGLRPRHLPFGHDLAGVHVLRTLDDTLTLRAELLGGPRVVVIGAGFLGSEIAATARGLGLDVTLVDVETTPLARQIGSDVGELVARTHRDHGVDVRMRRHVTGMTGQNGRVAAVVLDDGSRLAADVVVVAIGSVPATDWLTDSGIPLGDGVLCDPTCKAAPGVYAAGDVANWPHPLVGGRIRLEQRTNATLQAVTAAKNLLSDPDGALPYAPMPFGWTDQYDTKIQIHGWCPPDAHVEVVDGDVRSRTFVALYRTGGRVVGALGWNSPRALLRYRGHIAQHPGA